MSTRRGPIFYLGGREVIGVFQLFSAKKATQNNSDLATRIFKMIENFFKERPKNFRRFTNIFRLFPINLRTGIAQDFRGRSEDVSTISVIHFNIIGCILFLMRNPMVTLK